MFFPWSPLAKLICAATSLTAVVCLVLWPLGRLAAGSVWADGPGHWSTLLRIEGTRDTGFERVPPALTGLTFTNRLFGEMFLTNTVAHDGAGVAVSDVDGDLDLYAANYIDVMNVAVSTDLSCLH